MNRCGGSRRISVIHGEQRSRPMNLIRMLWDAKYRWCVPMIRNIRVLGILRRWWMVLCRGACLAIWSLWNGFSTS